MTKRFERIYADVDVFCRDHNAKGLSQLIERDDYDKIVDLLNELNDENEQLKSIKKFADRNGICIFNIDEAFRRCWQDNAKLVKENEQLKQSYIQLKHRHSLLHDECLDAECDRDSYHNDVLSLEKENEQLKEEIKDLNDVLARYEEKELEND